MLQPKKRKYKKEMRGRMKGMAKGGDTLSFGEYGLQSTSRGWVRAREIEAARKAVVNHTKRKGKLWINVFPHKPVTVKSAEVVRGGGKGEVDHYVAVVKPARVIFEIGGIPEDMAREALRLAAQKMSITTRVISK